MSNSPAFQYYPADLLSDPEVMFWDMEAIGCYWQMITFLWLNGGKFEYNLKNLCKLFRVNHKKTAEKLWKNIEKKFVLENGIVTHKRVLKEMQKQAESRLRRQRAGQKGAETRWGKNDYANSNVTSKAMAEDGPSTSTSISPSTSEKTLITNKEILLKELKGDAKGYYNWLREEFVLKTPFDRKTFGVYAKLCKAMSERDDKLKIWITDTVMDIKDGAKKNNLTYPAPNKMFVTAINNKIKKLAITDSPPIKT